MLTNKVQGKKLQRLRYLLPDLFSVVSHPHKNTTVIYSKYYSVFNNLIDGYTPNRDRKCC